LKDPTHVGSRLLPLFPTHTHAHPGLHRFPHRIHTHLVWFTGSAFWLVCRCRLHTWFWFWAFVYRFTGLRLRLRAWFTHTGNVCTRCTTLGLLHTFYSLVLPHTVPTPHWILFGFKLVWFILHTVYTRLVSGFWRLAEERYS